MGHKVVKGGQRETGFVEIETRMGVEMDSGEQGRCSERTAKKWN